MPSILNSFSLSPSQVSKRFSKFISNITLTDQQLADGRTKYEGVVSCLNQNYRPLGSASANSKLIGSWAKYTRIRPPRDIDILFELPIEVYNRYQLRPGNKQSQLLQEIKWVLGGTYPRTDIRGDGQVVVVPFQSYAIEVAPAILLQNGQYWVCDTNDGGKYKVADPGADLINFEASNKSTNGNTRDLTSVVYQ